MAAGDNFKEYKKIVGEARDLTKGLQKDIAQAFDAGMDNALMGIKKLEGATTKAAKAQKKLYEESIDLTKDILENRQNIGTEEFKSLDVSKQLAKARKQNDNILVKQLTHLKSINRQQKQQHKQIQAMADLAAKPFEAVDSFIKEIPVVGDLLAASVGSSSWGEAIRAGVLEGGTSGFVESLGLFDKGGMFSKKMGKAFSESGKEIPITKAGELDKRFKKAEESSGGVASNIMGMTSFKVGLGSVVALAAMAAAKMASFANETGISYNQTIAMGGALLVNSDAVKAFADELGTVNNLTTGQALTLKLQEKRYGLSAQSAAKLFAVQSSISGASMETFLTSTKTTAELARQAGVAPKAVFDDMAQNAEAIARFSGQSTKSMTEAAIQAKSMGLGLSSTAKMAEALLDFETSISNQQEASMLLGKTINMDKARELMFVGDMKGMQDEVLNQLRSIGNFNDLHVVQKDALAKLTNLEVTELGKMMNPTLAAADAAKQQKDELIGAAAAGAAVGATILGVLMAGKAILTGGLSLTKDIGLALAGGAAGATAGAVIGGLGYGAYVGARQLYQSDSDLPQLAMGGDIKATGAAVVHEGESVGNLSKVERRLSELVTESKLLREQNEFLMGRLTSKVNSLGLSS